MIRKGRNGSTAVRRFSTALLGGVLLANALAAQATGEGRAAARIAPPASISCDRNKLTSWTGEISAYQRSGNRTWLEVTTDYQTTEHTAIDHDGQPDASARYLLWGEPFTGQDWVLIEYSPGVLIEGMRATVWMCEDGTTAPVVDWQPPDK